MNRLSQSLYWIVRSAFARVAPPGKGLFFLLLWISVCSTVLLTGCAPRVGGGDAAVSTPEAALVVDLPALIIDYDREGGAYLGSVPMGALEPVLGVDLTPLNLTATQIDGLIDANIQHIQLTNQPQSLTLLINGRALPRLIWQREALATSIDLLFDQDVVATLVSERLDGDDTFTDMLTLLPLLTEMGGGLTLRFPPSSESARLSLAEISTDHTTSVAAQSAYLALINVPPAIHLDVFYQLDGTWRVDGLDATVWSQVFPVPWERLNLTPATIAAMQEAGIAEVVLASDQQGATLWIDNQLLTTLDWSHGELSNVVLLAEESELFTQLLGNTPTAYSLANALEGLLPLMQVTEVRLVVHFPSSL